MKISKKINIFLSHVPRMTQPKNLVARSNSVPCSPFTNRHTDRHIDRVDTENTLSGFQDCFLQPIIKDRGCACV